MNKFDFWTQWGLELDDRRFANAFLVLGILATFPKDGISAEEDLPELMSAILNKARSKSGVLPWRFPDPDRGILIGRDRVKLSALQPTLVADAWAKIPEDAASLISLQILRHPLLERISPWFRMLFEAVPNIKAAYIVQDSEPKGLHLKWPIRIGYLSDNAGGKSIVDNISVDETNSNLISRYEIDRKNSNCDFLVFSGESRQLLRKLLDMPGSQKSRLVIVRGRIDDEKASIKQRLSALSSETFAGGYIFLASDASDTVASEALGEFISQLSHNESMDRAIATAFARRRNADPVIFLNRQLAEFRAEDILANIRTRIFALPKIVSPELDLNALCLSCEETGPDAPESGSVARGFAKAKPGLKIRLKKEGSAKIAAISATLDKAEMRMAEKQPPRFLQGKVLVKRQGKFVREVRVFPKGMPILIQVRIGPSDEEWISASARFPDSSLSKNMEEWHLEAVLTEPVHLKEPLRRLITLPKSGPSSIGEFLLQLEKDIDFEGQVTVLHRGRVLQTFILKGRVVSSENEIADTDAITCAYASARSHLNDLDGRGQFNLAIVEKPASDNRTAITAIAQNHAWVTDTSACRKAVEKIGELLSQIANQAPDYSKGLGSKENRELLVGLARNGQILYDEIVQGNLMDPENQSEFIKMDYLQIVSTQEDTLLPLEFIYDAGCPDDNASLCPGFAAIVKEPDRDKQMRQTLDLINKVCDKSKEHPSACPYRTDAHICIMGFWGLSKVIERHMSTPSLGQAFPFYIESEATSARNELEVSGTALVAASEKVESPDADSVVLACQEQLGSPACKAANWEEWVKLIAQYKPHVLLALPHSDGEGDTATLEIGGIPILCGKIKDVYVHPKDDATTYPLVILLGCNTAISGFNLSRSITRFRREKAALVIGTVSQVAGNHAADVAVQLIKGLKKIPDSPDRQCIGEVLRSIKQRSVIEGQLMAMSVVAFGDADWKVK